MNQYVIISYLTQLTLIQLIFNIYLCAHFKSLMKSIFRLSIDISILNLFFQSIDKAVDPSIQYGLLGGLVTGCPSIYSLCSRFLDINLRH